MSSQVKHSYCVKCKAKTPSINQVKTVTKNKRPAIKSKCKICDTSKFVFVSLKEGGDIKRSSRQGEAVDIQKWITEKFPDTELHLPVVTHKGIEKAAFAGPGTKLDKRIKNLDHNAQQAWNGKKVSGKDITTKPKSTMDEAAMYHDLRYHHASNVAKNEKELLKMKNSADMYLMRDNAVNVLNPFNVNPAIGAKMAYERLT